MSYATASRNGEPFAAMVRSQRYLPNAVRRTCTQRLKVTPIDMFVRRGLGWPSKRIKNMTGIRFDEPKRWKKAIYEGCRVEMPLVLAEVHRADVIRFWNNQPFDLRIDSHLSNCDLCFLKGQRHIVDLLTREPGLADWWIDMEDEIGTTFFSTKRKQGGYRDLLKAAREGLATDPEPHTDDADLCNCTDWRE